MQIISLEVNSMIKDILNSYWPSFATAVTVVAVAVGVVCYRRDGTKLSPLPGMKMKPLFLYLISFKLTFWNRNIIPPLCLVLQVLHGVCHLFDRERIMQFWIVNRSIVLIYKPETMEVILSSPVAIEKADEYRFLHPWLGTGLLTSNREKWRNRRKLLTPAFHFRILEDFVPIFDEQSAVLVSNLKSLVQEPWVDIVPLMTMCTLDIICQTAMGVQINAQGGGCSDYIKAIYEIGEIFMYRICRPWIWNDSVFYCFPLGRKFKKNLNLVHSFTRKIIKEKKQLIISEKWKKTKTYNNTDGNSLEIKKQRRVFLELLLEHHLENASFTEEDIREEVDTFMFEGHDTTAMAICWALYNLGLYKNIQEKVHKELDDVFQGDNSRSITQEDIKEMRYLECVIKETLRLYPSVPIIARETKNDVAVLNYKIPAGSMCFIFPLVLHRDPESFPNPEKFEPERFLPENCAGRHPYAYVPFSAGPRNCIGQRFAMMEEKTVIANILRHFQVISLDPRDKINIIPDLVIRNVEPIRLKFLPRKEN